MVLGEFVYRFDLMLFILQVLYVGVEGDLVFLDGLPKSFSFQHGDGGVAGTGSGRHGSITGCFAIPPGDHGVDRCIIGVCLSSGIARGNAGGGTGTLPVH